jgi:hypothetical protein
MSPTAARLVEELQPHTPFAAAIVRRQVERAGLSVASVSEADLPRVIPLVVAASSAFVEPPVLARLRSLILVIR